MTSYCLNPNIVPNLCVTVVLQSLITLFAIFLGIKIALGCFFASSTSSYPCFMIIDLYFLIPANIAKIFNPITDFVISIATDKANVFIETQPVTVETKMFLSV